MLPSLKQLPNLPNFQMILASFLALVACASALDCNVGNVIVENGIITSKSVENRFCEGQCSRTAIDVSTARQIVFMGCNDNEVSNFVNSAEGRLSCSESIVEPVCYCAEDLCNSLHLEESLNDIVPVSNDDINGPICYVGYFATNTGSPIMNQGDTVNCDSNSACASLNATAFGYDIEAYFCIPAFVCNTLIGQTTSDNKCNNLQNEMGTVYGCCCYGGDCTNLALKNPAINVPPTVTRDNTTVMCYQGAQLNYNLINGGSVSQCMGSCSSISIKTSLNNMTFLLDLFTCDPVELCTAIGINNQCGNIAFAGYNSLIRGCCCNTNNCIDPTTKPPIYPQKSLKCYTGLYVPATGYSQGAEMICPGQCGRMEVPINGNIVKYMMCAPYSMCYGLGIANADQCYNPPLEEDVKLCCCTGSDNCNIVPQDAPQINVNTSVIPTNNYPILCFGGIYLNGTAMTAGSYSMCPGECAMVSFVTTVFGQQHNTTLYTCDPVTMCNSAGIKNSCAVLQPGVTACCCDQDTCYDPNRQVYAQRTCYTGIYVANDNFLAGGEMQCNGWCASLSTVVNTKNTTTYWCAPVQTCRKFALGMGGDNNCNAISETSNTLTGCCCSESDNCNLPAFLLPNVTSIPARSEPPIVCYEALWINGINSGMDNYRVCNGECVSISMADMVNSTTTISSTLYTCDSSAACAAMGLRNGCGSVDGTVNSCCCDSDACIDPTVGRSPGVVLTCYVGIRTNWNGGISVGAEVNCDGKCANLTSTANGFPFTSYHCMPKDNCRALALDNSCNQINLDRAITGCCCDSSANCNVFPPVPSMNISQPGSPIACYSGIQVNGNWTGGSRWQVCNGDCVSLTLDTTFNGMELLATVFTCDPTSVCTGLNITNRCHNIEPGVRGCCCTDSACIDPTKNPPKMPRFRPLTCWVGMASTYNNMNVGAPTQCQGSCASFTSIVQGYNATIFACVAKTICSGLGLYDSCGVVTADRSLFGCCCDNVDNCNTLGFGVNTNVTVPRVQDYPIVCYQGMRVNGADIVTPQWATCNGDCASMYINTAINATAYNAEFYTCDPSTVCQQLYMINSCSTIEPGIGGCCCDTDACIDPTRNPAKLPGKPLKCYVGLATYNSTGKVIDIGNEVYCNTGSKCGTIYGLVGGFNVTAYMCAPLNICRTLQLNNEPKQLPGDRALTAFCCDNTNNCNVFDRTINTTAPVNPNVEYPITCYSGIFVDGKPITDGGFQSCNGDCAMITMNSTWYNGSTYSAQLYTCDPTAVCAGLGVYNNCSTIESGLDGCCCNSNACLDPTKNPPKKPGNPLQCYVGVRSTFQNLNVGATAYCNGKCSSISGVVGGQKVTIYNCVDASICQTLELDDTCSKLPLDRDLTACCCDNYNTCNVNDPSIVVPTPNPIVEFPIVCWQGIYFNGNPITANSWGICSGDCASVTISTTANGNVAVATLYTCDPSSVCSALSLANTCNTLEPGVQACCCNTDQCIDPRKGKDPSRPLQCYVGMTSTYQDLSVGATVNCNGRCSSLSGIVGGYQVATYHCVETSICRTLELDDACIGLPGDRNIKGCCCDNAPFCNIAGTNLTQLPPSTSTEAPIACFSGIYINGNPISSYNYNACNGQCASMSMTTIYGGMNTTATIYTCDPSSICDALNVSNACQIIEPSVVGCCCNTDGCISPTKNPNTPLTCFVGIWAAKGNYSVGADTDCSGGSCVSLRTVINNSAVKAYTCDKDGNTCKALQIANSCGVITTDRDITGCCCDGPDNCNVGREIVNRNFTMPPFTGPPIACWSGIYVDGMPLGATGWTSCNGQCAAIQFNTTSMNGLHSTTLYTCDPVAVCTGLGINNDCATIDDLPGLTGCCCGTSACMNGNSIYPNHPENLPLTCYVGVYATANNYSIGADIDCTGGSCMSLTTYISDSLVRAYSCDQTGSICNALQLTDDNSCHTISNDRDVTACCCYGTDNCNVGDEIVNKNFTMPPVTNPPIECWSGIYVDGIPLGSTGWASCNGQCAAIQLNTTLSDGAHSATLYTCDPAAVCTGLGINNNCQTIDALPGVTGCCCGTNACLNGNSIYPNTTHTATPLICYVGVYAASNNFSVGADIDCTGGNCMSLTTTISNSIVKAYSCDQTGNTCQPLLLTNNCGTIRTDRDITACCCDGGNNCNVGPEIVNKNFTMPPVSSTPIACWSGIYIDGNAMGSTGWSNCYGQCAAIQFNTTMNGTHSATLYTCDPVSVCTGLGINNNCQTIDSLPGFTGCCCGTNACLNGNSIYPNVTQPATPLTCYVGVFAASNNYSVGADIDCTGGNCMSLTTTISNSIVKAYSCDQSRNTCTSLKLVDSCSTISTDRDITACCCEWSNNCNVGDEIVYKNFSMPPFTGTPIACWSGIYVDGKPIGSTGWSNCNGQCAAMQLNTTLNGNHSATLYTCDPVAVCTGLGINNNCQTIDALPGLTGCCCGTNACLNGNSIYPNTIPNNTQPLSCYVGVWAKKNNYSVGADIDCTGGNCVSLSTVISNSPVKAYSCDQTGNTCKSLQLANNCSTIFTDRDITGCCCNGNNNCNVGAEILNRNFTMIPFTGTPIACWSGIYVDGKPLGTTGWSNCNGQCAAMQLNTTMNGAHSATLYTCDPAAVCTGLGINNNCTTIDALPGLTGCCCGTNACLNGNSIYPNVTRPDTNTDKPLNCYVGVWAQLNNYNVGSEIDCTGGKCMSLSTVMNNISVKAYSCDMSGNTCKSLQLSNSCGAIGADRDITGCCCDGPDNCNIGPEIVNRNFTITPFTGVPLACWSGIYVDGKAIGHTGWYSCNGQCTAMQLNTTLSGVHSATLYACDPAAVCTGLGIKNQCSTIDSLPGLTGCCCGTDACLDGNSINPKTTNGSAQLTTFAVLLTTLFVMFFRPN